MLKSIVLTGLGIFSLTSLCSSNPLPDESLVDPTPYYVGTGTWYNHISGPCSEEVLGKTLIVGVSSSLKQPDGSSYCGSTVSIMELPSSIVVNGTVSGVCDACGSNDLAMSPTLYEKLASLNEVNITIEWTFSVIETTA